MPQAKRARDAAELVTYCTQRKIGLKMIRVMDAEEISIARVTALCASEIYPHHATPNRFKAVRSSGNTYQRDDDVFVTTKDAASYRLTP